MLDKFRQLPKRLEDWIHHLFSRKSFLIFGAITFILGSIVTAILQGESLDFWHKSIRPWLDMSRNINNGLFLVLVLGCALFVVTLMALWIIHGANRHQLGQLESVKQDNTNLNQEVIRFTSDISLLTKQVTDFTHLQLETEKRLKETRLLNIISNIDRELFVLLAQPTNSEAEIQKFTEGMFRRTFDLWGLDKVHRAAVYTPDGLDSRFLTIKWDYGLGEVSRHWSRWYIGSSDPTSEGLYRGIAGSVYLRGEGRASPDITKDPDFVDLYVPKRPYLPYQSAVHALIHPDDKQKKLGVLCFDSLNYVFTDHDLILVQEVASRIGWFMQSCRVIPQTRRKGVKQNEQ